MGIHLGPRCILCSYTGGSQNQGYHSLIIVFWGLCWGPPNLGNYHMGTLGNPSASKGAQRAGMASSP